MSAQPEQDPRWDIIRGYVERGWPVLRLRGKVPAGKPRDAYIAFTADTIAARFPIGGTWNWGLPLDHMPGLIVIDIDAAKHPGCVAEFLKITGIDICDDLDGNCRVRTGGAAGDGTQPGRHILFWADPEEIKIEGWDAGDGLHGVPGLDVKVSHVMSSGEQAQCHVVLPGSTHPDSGLLYAMASEVIKPQPITDGIRAYLSGKPKRIRSQEKPLRVLPDAAVEPAGERRIIPPDGLLDDDRLSRIRYVKAVEACVNDIRKAGPGQRQGGTNAAAYKLGYLTQHLPGSIRAEALSAAQAASDARMSPEDLAADKQKRPGDVERGWNAGSAVALDGNFGDPIPPFRSQAGASEPSRAREDDPEMPATASTIEPFRMYSIGEIREWPEPVEVIEGMICEGDLFGIVAPYSSGKSAVALDIALHIATGTHWQGRQVTQGGVLYIAAENAAGYAKRIEAWAAMHDAPMSSVPFLLIKAPMKLDGNGVDATRLQESVRAASLSIGQPIRWVVIDTVRRTMQGDENTSGDFQRYVDACDAIRTAFGCVVNLVHHSSSKADKPGGRGSSVWGDALAPIIAIRAGSDLRARTLELSCQEIRGGKPPKDLEPFVNIEMHLDGIELGRMNRRGYPVTGVVALDGAHPAGPGATDYLEQVETVREWVVANPGATRTRIANECCGTILGIGNQQRKIELVARMIEDGHLKDHGNRKAVTVGYPTDLLKGGFEA